MLHERPGLAGLVAGETVLAQLMGSSPFSFSSYRPPPINPAGCAPRVSNAHLPDRFLWGTSTAAYQVEPCLHNTDWAQWLKTHGSGDNPDLGPDFVHLNFDGTIGGYFREYLDAARAMGQTSFRLSLDWSRIQPEKDGPVVDLAYAGVSAPMIATKAAICRWRSGCSLVSTANASRCARRVGQAGSSVSPER
jgi:hypothetical protein